MGACGYENQIGILEKTDQMLFRRGGTLLITDKEVIVKGAFCREIAFDRFTLRYNELPDEFFCKAVELCDSFKSVTCILYKSAYKKLTDEL